MAKVSKLIESLTVCPEIHPASVVFFPCLTLQIYLSGFGYQSTSEGFSLEPVYEISQQNKIYAMVTASSIVFSLGTVHGAQTPYPMDISDSDIIILDPKHNIL